MLDLISYMVERHAATVRRRAGQAGPWSDEPIIAKCFLCSVLRDDDRTSVQAREYISTAPAEDQASLASTFRYINHVPSMIEIHQAGALRDNGRVLDILHAREARAEKVLGAQAYKINTPKGLWSLEGVSLMVGKLALRPAPRNNSGRAQVIDLVRRGVSPFIAYQIMQDLRWVYGPYTDEDDWALVGPGALRGLKRLAGNYGAPKTWQERRSAKSSISMPAGARSVMLTVLSAAREKLIVTMNLYEIEHNLCEYDKYCRIATKEGTGRVFKPKPPLL